MDEASLIGGCVRTGLVSVTAKQDEGGDAVGGHHQPAVHYLRRQHHNAVGGYHAHGEVVQVTACCRQLFRRGVDLNSQRLAQGEREFLE